MLDFERLLNDAENGVLPALKFLGDIYLNGYKENDIEPNLEKAIEFWSIYGTRLQKRHCVL